MLTFENRPPIFVPVTEHERLRNLAEASLGDEPGAEILLDELDRATIGTFNEMPADAVRMNDRVSFTHNGRFYRDYVLVYPNESDIATLRVSVLTQIGAMLLGLSPCQVITWTDVGCRPHRLEVINVTRSN